MTLEDVLRQLEDDRAAHTTSGPSDEAELRGVEEALQQALPATLRAFLLRIGGGIFYGRHEIFGGHRVMIHDIELVPSLREMVRQTRARQPDLERAWLPVHRADGVLHLMDAEAQRGLVSQPAGQQHASFESFLELVVLSAARRPGTHV